MPLSSNDIKIIAEAFDASAPLQQIIATHGRRVVMDGIDQLFSERKKQVTLTSIQNALSVTVSSWTTLVSSLDAADSSTLPSAIQGVDAAIASTNANQLGPRLFAVYAAAKKHLSI